MKSLLTYLSICAAALFLTSCAAGTRVQKTYVATGAVNPKAIYIRPFEVNTENFKGYYGTKGERPIRASIAGKLFADTLAEQMSKIAPTAVLADDETAPIGWLIDGELVKVDAGCPYARFILRHTGIGKSEALIHVRVRDVARLGSESDRSKGDSSVLYEFDVKASSGLTDTLGGVQHSGIGSEVPFDFRNTAERIMFVLSEDPHRYGFRQANTIR